MDVEVEVEVDMDVLEVGTDEANDELLAADCDLARLEMGLGAVPAVALVPLGRIDPLALEEPLSRPRGQGPVPLGLRRIDGAGEQWFGDALAGMGIAGRTYPDPVVAMLGNCTVMRGCECESDPGVGTVDGSKVGMDWTGMGGSGKSRVRRCKRRSPDGVWRAPRISAESGESICRPDQQRGEGTRCRYDLRSVSSRLCCFEVVNAD
jgi:hypothetical protein